MYLTAICPDTEYARSQGWVGKKMIYVIDKGLARVYVDDKGPFRDILPSKLGLHA